MAEKVFKMTAEGKAQLEAELDSLKTEGRIDIAEKLKVARSYGDLSENSEYDEAKSEQAKIEARINELEYQLFFFNDTATTEIYTFDANEHNLDNINQGKNLFSLVDLTGEQRYRDAINTIRAQLDTQPRTKDGNFWHKAIYPWQVWLDGTYMAQPFYMEYETRYNGMKGCQDSYKQFMNIKKYMRDPKTGLYYHGYDESRQMYWADPVTGCSANFWLRAMGWFLVAMVDVLERMDEQMYYEYRAIMAMFKEAVEAMIQFQDAETGMFWQVIDKAGVPGNYLETSGSSLFAYAVLKGVRLGYLPKRFRAYGEKAFYGTCDKYLGVNDKGELQLSGICLVAGLGGATRRDGSLEYYFSEPVVENDAKGVAPLLLAYTEMIIQ